MSGGRDDGRGRAHALAPKVLLTGAPGSGKSTLAGRVVEWARARGLEVCGVASPEMRGPRGRTGFAIVDLASGTRRVMASVGKSGAPLVGKYTVHVAAIDAVAARFLASLPRAELLVIDEIGKMESYSRRFHEAVDAAFAAPVPLLAVVHRAMAPQYGAQGELIQVTPDRRDALVDVVLEKLGLGQERSWPAMP